MNAIVHLPDTWTEPDQKGTRCGLVFKQPGWTEGASVILDREDRDQVNCIPCLNEPEEVTVA